MAVSIPVGARADESSFKDIARQAEEFFKATGEDVGKAFADELATGMESGSKAVQASAKKVADSYDKVADATGKVRAEQEKLNSAQASGRQDRIVAQAERLEKARRDESRAIRTVIGDLKDYEKAADDAGRTAHSAFGKGFGAGFSRSHVGGFFADLKSEAQSSGSMAGVLAGRAMGAGLTLGLGAATAGVATAIGGIGYTLTKGFQRLEGIDQAQFKLKALGHSGSEVSKIMGDAESSVKGTAFALDEAVGAAASAVAAGVQPGQDLANYLTTIGDTAAVANTSFDEMASIFNKVTTSNKAYTQELRQLADRGIPIFTWLQQAYRVSGEELDKMVRDGAVDAATFQRVIADHIGGAAKEMGQSFSGAVDNLGASVARLGAAAIGAPFESAAGAIGGLTGKLDEMKSWLDANQDKVINFWSGLADVAVSSLSAVNTAISGTMTLIGGLLRGMSAVDKFLDHIPGMGGNQGEAAQLDQWADSIFKLRDGIDAAGPKLDDFHNSIKDWADQSKFGAAFGKATPEISGGDVITDLPVGPSVARTELSKLGFGVAPGPDGKVKIVPKTDDATKILDAWRAKQGSESLRAPVQTDLTATDVIAGGGTGGKGGGKGSAPPPYFDESRYSLAANPVAGSSVGPTDDTRILSARERVEEARLRLLEMESKENVSQSALVSAKNNVLQAERGLREAELQATKSHEKQLKDHTGAMQQLGAQIDQDFGISKGLPGIAENLTKFLANLAFAPALGALQAVVTASGINQGGGGAAAGIGGVGVAGIGMSAGYGGGNLGAMYALAQGASGRTKYGPASDLVNGLADCSGSISDLVEVLQTGKSSPARLFDTTAFATPESAAQFGFRPGSMPGAFNIGVTPLPGQAGHMAATLPNGINFEGGGGTGGGAQYGGSAAGAFDPQFSKRYYLPVAGGDGASAPVGIGTSLYSPDNTNPGLNDPLAAGLGAGGGGGMGVPGSMAPPPQMSPFSPLGGGAGPAAPMGIAPSVGAGGEGFQGISGLPMDALMMGTMALGPAGIVAQKGIQLANRAIGYGGQLVGIGVQGLLNTFLPRESPLADIGNSWFGRIASGFAGVRPAGQNMAGQSTLPNPEQAQKKANGGSGGQDGGQGGINNTFNIDASDRGDSQGIARDTAHAVNSAQQYAMPGPRGR